MPFASKSFYKVIKTIVAIGKSNPVYKVIIVIYYKVIKINVMIIFSLRAKRPGLDLTFHRAIDLTRDIKVIVMMSQSSTYF